MTLQHIIGYLLVLGAPTVLALLAWFVPPKNETDRFMARVNEADRSVARLFATLLALGTYFFFGIYLISL